jgi:hypothetical protein
MTLSEKQAERKERKYSYRNEILQYFKEPHTIPEWRAACFTTSNWVVTELSGDGFLKIIGTVNNGRYKAINIYKTVIEFYDESLVVKKPPKVITFGLLDRKDMHEKYRLQNRQAREERKSARVQPNSVNYETF